MSSPKEEPILYFVGKIPIRKENRFTINLNENEMARVAKVINETGLSVSKVISLISQPCGDCGNDNVNFSIQRGILSTKKGNNGGKLLKKEK